MLNMDSALAVYVFAYWSFNSNEENLMNLRTCLLFREFLNFIGWDHSKLLANYKIYDKRLKKINEDYTAVMLAENLPELVDDFLEVYLKKDAPNFTSNLCEIKNFISEFCNFLYNEGVINYMIEPIA